MSNLQPLVWTDTLTTTTIFRTYKVRLDVKGRFSVYYESSTGKPATGFISVDDAKHWAEFTHYASEMQPYVKPSPTWIDVSKQLPQVDKDTQFICAYDSAIEPYVRVTTFSVEMGDFGLDHSDILAWMPIPEFSTMQNNKGD